MVETKVSYNGRFLIKDESIHGQGITVPLHEEVSNDLVNSCDYHCCNPSILSHL